MRACSHHWFGVVIMVWHCCYCFVVITRLPDQYIDMILTEKIRQWSVWTWYSLGSPNSVFSTSGLMPWEEKVFLISSWMLNKPLKLFISYAVNERFMVFLTWRILFNMLIWLTHACTALLKLLNQSSSNLHSVPLLQKFSNLAIMTSASGCLTWLSITAAQGGPGNAKTTWVDFFC